MAKSQETSNSAGRTRRNLFKVGAKLGAVAGAAAMVTLARIKPAAAHHRHYKHHQCFMKGTMIATVDGDRRIEDLKVGDRLPSMFGGNRPIQWIGYYEVKRSDPQRPWTKDALPVRIAASALAPNVPHTDLFLTQGHALYFDGVLVPAGCLVNGTTITLYDAREYEKLEFYHIEFATHDVVYAEGAPCETLLQANDNAAHNDDYFRVPKRPAAEPKPCVPLQTYSGGRSEIKSRLRSAFSPWIDRREKIDVVRDYLEERGRTFR